MNWDNYFYNICEAVSSNSKCLSRKLGAVITNEKYIVSTGYNGPPRGCPHCNEEAYRSYIFGVASNDISNLHSVEDTNSKTCPRKVMGFISGNGLQYCPASHAERNAIYTAARLGTSIEGCILYLNWITPCVECCKAIINSGIKEVVVTSLDNYEHSGIKGIDLLKYAGIKIRAYNFD